MPPRLEDYKPTGTGEPPLAKAKDWIRYSDKATRETNTMPQWAGSCWYYLRFCDPRNDRRFVGEEAERYWMGGEQAGRCRSLRRRHRARRAASALCALLAQGACSISAIVSKPEPFQRLVNQGIILGEDNQKMSKSRGQYRESARCDRPSTARTLFAATRCLWDPLEQMKPWSMRGVEGVSRFLARVWRLFMDENQAGEWELSPRKSKRSTQTKPNKR